MVVGRKSQDAGTEHRKHPRVKAKHKSNKQKHSLVCKSFGGFFCFWRWQPFKRGKQLPHGMLAMVTEVEVEVVWVDVIHAYRRVEK